MRRVAVQLLVSVLVLWCCVWTACGSDVSVPYKTCGSATDDVNITSLVSNSWPPSKGSTLSLNITGNNSKDITSGGYTISITVNGVPLPDITGDIDVFRPLPWPVGELLCTYSQDIPSIAPSGQYKVKISAVDQDSVEIFCINVAFSLSAAADADDADATDALLQQLQQRRLPLPVKRHSRIPPLPRMRR